MVESESGMAAVGPQRDGSHPVHLSMEPLSIDQEHRGDEGAVSLRDIHYGMESFYAIVKPVFLTMVLAALSVIYISTPEHARAQSAGLANTYTVRQSDENANNAQKLGDSLLNGIIIVCVVCALTFFIVILYKYRCMKILLGYMILSSMLLLGFLCSIMFEVAIDRYELNVDVLSFYFFLYNFSVVGTVAIFFGKGIPPFVTQGYLIATSVIVAWQLAFFDAWTAWVLLVLLALYDLFAVLTPCGPLKALVNLMQQEDAPDMPGLLYEASLPDTARRRRRRSNPRPEPSSISPESTTSACNERESEAIGDTTPTMQSGQQLANDSSPASDGSHDTYRPADTHVIHDTVPSPSRSRQVISAIHDSGEGQREETDPELSTYPTGQIPLAIAKLYKLPLLNNPNPSWRRPREEGQEVESFSSEELLSMVTAVFQHGGGRIVPQPNRPPSGPRQWHRQSANSEPRFVVMDRHGALKRTLFVNREGRVFEDLTNRQNGDDDDDESSGRNSIKLGLGDFIFYSILVSKAAIYSFATFAASSLAILAGLGLTLLLLAIRGQALPALPISIFLGVVFYLTTRYVLEPWVEELFLHQVYI